MPYSLSIPELLEEQLIGRDNDAAWHAGQTLLTLKCEPETALFLRQQHPEILPGFYMDKRSWNSIRLDGDLPEDLVRALCEQSYRLVFQKLTKKLQKELLQP